MLVVLAAGIAGPSAAAAGLTRRARSATPAPARALRISAIVGRSGVRIPNGFSGLSIEAADVPRWARAAAALRPVLSLIRAPDAPLLIRVGGASADKLWWRGLRGHRPPRTIPVGEAWVRNLATLASTVDTGMVLTVDLTVDRPGGEAAFARTVARALPPRTLVAVEIGNEPDLYAGEPWLDGRRPRRPGRPPWTVGYTPSVYRHDYIRYARAIRHVLPHVAFQAPDITAPAPAWLQAPEGLGSLSPRLIAIHRYPLCYCLSPRSPLYPTVARLLNYRASALLASSLQFAVPYAAAHHAKLVVSEFNSIACAGKCLPIRSIATALWGLDAMFEMVKEGVAGVDWHVRPGFPNAPFSFGPHGITVAPELYAMVIFAELERSGARVLTTSTRGTGASSVVLWAVSGAGHLALLLLNKTPRPAAATVNLPASLDAVATVRRLVQPAGPASTRFGGQWIGPDGQWHGTPNSETVAIARGELHLSLAPLSAALVDVGAPTPAANPYAIAAGSRPGAAASVHRST